MSVHCADNNTEIKRVKLLVWVRGEGVLGYSLLSSLSIIFALSFFSNFTKNYLIPRTWCILYKPGFLFASHLAAPIAPSANKSLE